MLGIQKKMNINKLYPKELLKNSLIIETLDKIFLMILYFPFGNYLIQFYIKFQFFVYYLNYNRIIVLLTLVLALAKIS